MGKVLISNTVFLRYWCEWSGSSSGLFVSDLLCTEVQGSLDVAADVMVNNWKRAHSYKTRNRRIGEEKLPD